MNGTFESILDNFNNITSKPENFISAQSSYCTEIKSFVKSAYDFTKEEEGKSKKINALPELIIDNFDLEQIWQEIELQNEEFLSKSITKVSKFVVGKERLLFDELEEDLPPDKIENNEEIKNVESENLSNSDSEIEDENMQDHNSQSSEDENMEDHNSQSSEDESNTHEETDDDRENVEEKFKNKSIVDDDFFKLDEMEEFLKLEEKVLDKKTNDDSGNESESKEDNGIDFFESGSEINDENDDEHLREKNPRYKDFFRPSNESKPFKKNKFLEEEPLDNENVEKNLKSTFELREERLRNKIKSIEDNALSEKPWQLQGEITAQNRPQNSLLEEIVEFDLTSRPAPVITEKTTLQLEDIIRQRIKDRAFDSVERKEKPMETPLEYKKKLVLNQEKSKESLAQIYEKEYLQQQEGIGENVEEKEEEEPQLHKEIEKMKQNLFRQLDALSNFHFTPKPSVPELKIVSNLPAITMEEVAPIAVTDASLLAPEEVKKRIKGDIIGKSERSDADKNRERRKKKKKQRIHANEKKKRENLVNKMNSGLGNKYSKEKVKKHLENIIKDKNIDKMDETIGSKSVKSSTAFFKQLEEVKSHIKINSQKSLPKVTNGISAKKLKL